MLAGEASRVSQNTVFVTETDSLAGTAAVGQQGARPEAGHAGRRPGGTLARQGRTQAGRGRARRRKRGAARSAQSLIMAASLH